MKTVVYNRAWNTNPMPEFRIAFKTAELKAFEPQIREIMPEDTTIKLDDHLAGCDPLFIFIRVNAAASVCACVPSVPLLHSRRLPVSCCVGRVCPFSSLCYSIKIS